jgi:hypothetical protein
VFTNLVFVIIKGVFIVVRKIGATFYSRVVLLHSTLSEVFHQIKELSAIVFQEVIGDGQYTI